MWGLENEEADRIPSPPAGRLFPFSVSDLLALNRSDIQEDEDAAASILPAPCVDSDPALSRRWGQGDEGWGQFLPAAAARRTLPPLQTAPKTE